MTNPPLIPPSGSDPELDALLGAYALDAVDDTERARVDSYLATNRSARDEVDELRESAASLALAPVDDVTLPAGLWDRISANIAEAPREFTPLRPRERRTLSARVVSIVAVAAAVALIALTAQVVVMNGRSGPHDLNAAFAKAQTQDGAQHVALAPANGVEVARIVLLPDGSGFMKNDNMKALPSDETYQLWALSGDPDHPIAISAGVLGANPGTVAFHLAGQVHGFGVTVERSPGVVASTQPMYASASVA
jgi:anti-sigma-K factor RskA